MKQKGTNMVTIRFVLNSENIIKAGHTEREIIGFLHDFYVVERNATEIAPLVYQRGDENAMCSFGRNPSDWEKIQNGVTAHCGWCGEDFQSLS